MLLGDFLRFKMNCYRTLSDCTQRMEASIGKKLQTLEREANLKKKLSIFKKRLSEIQIKSLKEREANP